MNLVNEADVLSMPIRHAGPSKHYKDFLIKKHNYDGCVEDPHGFLLYRIFPEFQEAQVGEIYIEASKRRLGIGKELADKFTALAKAANCKIMSCQTVLTGSEDELSMLAILSYGFRPLKVMPPTQGNNGTVIYIKEIQ
jgi:GNAT superfamily N-acetyltransferase